MMKKKGIQKGEKETKKVNIDCSIKKIDSREWKIVYNPMKSYDFKKYAQRSILCKRGHFL